MGRPTMLIGHISLIRLKEVGVNDVLFTSDESSHLKECAECFKQWEDFVRAQSNANSEDD